MIGECIAIGVLAFSAFYVAVRVLAVAEKNFNNRRDVQYEARKQTRNRYCMAAAVYATKHERSGIFLPSRNQRKN